MRLLLISFSFPPAGGVGVLRALSLAKYLPEHGIRMDVLSAGNAPSVGSDPGLLAQVPSSVTVHRCWTPDLPFAARKFIKRLVSGRKAGPAPAASLNGAKKQPGLLRSLIGNLLLPDPQVGWVPFATSAAKRIIRTRAVDAVIVTVPPFSSAMLVKRLRKAFPHLIIILDVRDEWLATTLQLVSFNSNDRARQVAARIESEAVEAATAVVAVTEASRRLMSDRSPARARAIHSIPNGFDGAYPRGETSWTVRTTNQDRVILTFLGSVYGSTDPTTLVEAVRTLPAEIKARLLLRFIGHVEDPHQRALLESLGPTVELSGFLPQAEALARGRETDYFLLVTRDPVNVSAKLYDYMGAGRPILGVVHPEGDARRILEETRSGWWADISSPEAIAALLQAAVERAPHLQSEFRPDEAAVARYHRRELSTQYAALLSSLAAESHSAGGAAS